VNVEGPLWQPWTVQNAFSEAGLPRQAGAEPARSAQEHGHIVQFYEGEEFLCDVVAEFMATGLRKREPIIVIATDAHRRAFLASLAARGLEVAAALGTGQLIMLDARETLDCFMVDGLPDEAAFKSVLGGLLNKVCSAAPQRRVRAYGEMVNLLWQDGNAVAAELLEGLWNELAEVHSFSLLCAYHMANFHREAHGEAFSRVCQSHSHVQPAETYSPHEDSEVRFRQVSTLQQRAHALESEIEQHKITEAALRDALRMRDEFLTIASHELRTPLTALNLQLQSLSSALGEDDHDTLERLQKSNAQVKKLASLVEQLLDVTSMRAGRLSLAPQRMNLLDAVRETVENLSDSVTRSGSQVTLQGDPNVFGHWDPTRIDQVISNLLVNAFKYGRGKPIEVRVAAEDGKASLSVQDRGLGIHAADQERIFGRFERAVSTRNYGGFGLGLWIVQEIAKAHGGTVHVQSIPSQGATFTVELPLEGT
jgi:signal transduction histidine kinase